jgi:hypothetical protein
MREGKEKVLFVGRYIEVFKITSWILTNERIQ